MNDYSTIVDAINRLTATVNLAATTDQYADTFVTECISTALAVVGSVAAVLIFELIKNKRFSPRVEFRNLQRRVNAALSMYAHYYSSPMNIADLKTNEIARAEYINAATETRRMAIEIMAFADERKAKKFCGIEVEDIRKAGRHFIGLSNDLFSDEASSKQEYIEKRKSEIRKLLKLPKAN